MTRSLVFPAAMLLLCGLAGCRAQGGSRDLRNAITKLEQQMQNVDRYLTELERKSETRRDADQSKDEEIRKLKALLRTQEETLTRQINELKSDQKALEEAKAAGQREHEQALAEKQAELTKAQSEFERSRRAPPASADGAEATPAVKGPEIRKLPSPTQPAAAGPERRAHDKELGVENKALRARIAELEARMADMQRQGSAPPAAPANPGGGASNVQVHGSGSTLIIHADQGSVNVHVHDKGVSVSPSAATPSQPGGKQTPKSNASGS